MTLGVAPLPAQPRIEWVGHRKAVIRSISVPGLPAASYLVLSTGDSGTSVRFESGGMHRRISTIATLLDGPDAPIRLFHKGQDYLLGFWTSSGTTEYANFVLVSANPPKIRIARSFEYPTIVEFQRTGHLTEHLRHWQQGLRVQNPPEGLYTRSWRWSTRSHHFIALGHTFSKDWQGWDNRSLK